MIIRTTAEAIGDQYIGQVSFPAEIKPEVQTIIDYYTSMNDSKKQALQAMYDSLISEGLWSRIDNLYIPVLAPVLAEAMINIKNGNTDQTYTDTYLELTSNGLEEVSGAPTNSTVKTIPFSGTRANTSILFYSKTSKVINDLPSNQSGTDVMISGDSNYQLGIRGNGSFGLKFGSSSVNYAAPESNSLNGLYMVATGDFTGQPLVIGSDGESPTLASGTPPYTDAALSTLTPFMAFNGDFRLEIPCSIYAAANENFNASDYALLKAIFDQFISDLG